MSVKVVEVDEDALGEIWLALRVYQDLIGNGSDRVTRREITPAMRRAIAAVNWARRGEDDPPRPARKRSPLERRARQVLGLPTLAGTLGADPNGPPDGETVTTEQGTATIMPGDSPETIEAKLAAIGLVRSSDDDTATTWAFRHARVEIKVQPYGPISVTGDELRRGGR